MECPYTKQQWKPLNHNVGFEVFTVMSMKISSSEMWHYVDLMYTDVSEEHVASVLRVEELMRVRKSVGDTFLLNISL
jgi:hypothetical protein